MIVSKIELAMRGQLEQFTRAKKFHTVVPACLFRDCQSNLYPPRGLEEVEGDSQAFCLRKAGRAKPKRHGPDTLFKNCPVDTSISTLSKR